jgi:gliding motility-associated-like protein
VETWSKPFPDFDITDDDICLRGNVFEFEETGAIKSGSTQHEWMFGDGSNSVSGEEVSHSYKNDGKYWVKLKSTSDKGCVDSISKFINVWPMPKAAFRMNDSTQCFRGNEVVFTSESSVKTGQLTYYWDYNDGSQDSGITATHNYGTYKLFTPKHWIKTDKDCRDTIEKEVYIYPMPVADFTINDTGQCLNQQSFYFEDVSLIPSGKIRRNWTFFDSSSSQTTINRTFPDDIRYSIQLVQESEFGCLDTQLKFITVFPKPQPEFLVNDSAQCLNQNFYKFTNASTLKYGNMNYRWDIGEFGEIYTTKDADYFYSFWGVKQPLLTVTSDLGCVDSIRRTVKVNPMPEPQIGHNDSSQCFNDQNFIFWSKSKIGEGSLFHKWEMGDGSIQTLDSFTHYYNKDTFYTIKLIETSDKGCMDSVYAFAVARPSPEIEFRINDTLQCLRQNQFEITNYTRIKYGTTVGSWDFGDGTMSSDFEPIHIYKDHGTYTISLRAISNHGCADTLNKAVIVGAMPVMKYIVNDPGQCFLTHQFALLNLSNIADGTYQAYWHFGNDTVRVSNQDQLYKYAKVGDYPVKLIGVSNYGCMDSITQILSVNPNPQVRIVINDTDQCINNQYFRFTAQSLIERGNIRRYDWSLGEGDLNTYNTQSVQKTYQKSGFKTIRLINVSDSGCVDSTKRIIRVYPKPRAQILVNDSAQCLNQNDYVFTDISTDSLGVKRRWWDINGERNSVINPQGHIFGAPGFKEVKLSVESEWGCYDTTTRIVYVKPMPDARFDVLREFYCENTGNYPLTAFTQGGVFFGKNVINGSEFSPLKLWRDTVTYVVTVEGCTDSSKQFTQVYPQPIVNLGNDTTLCKNEMLELQLNSWNSQYKWDDGSSLALRRIVKPGLYWASATNLCGTTSDTVRIAFRDFNCRIFIPNAFTPTGDGLNEYFAPVAYDLDELSYQIYNRWGEKIYEGGLNDLGWDGTYLNADAPQGPYIINVRYKYTSGKRGIRGNDKQVFYLLR